MQTVKGSSLFTNLSSQASATVNGGWGYYSSPVTYHCYPVYYWGGSGSSGGSSVNQTVNVKVLIQD